MILPRLSEPFCVKGLSAKPTSWTYWSTKRYTEVDTLKATNGQFNARQEEFNQDRATLSLEKARLANQLKPILCGKQEGEITVRLRAENELLVKLAEDRARLEKTLLAKHAEYDLGRLQVNKRLILRKVQARMDAQRKIRQTSPFARE